MKKVYNIHLEQIGCANGETFEHRLFVQEDHPLAIPKIQVGESVFKRILIGDSLTSHAAECFAEIIRRITDDLG